MTLYAVTIFLSAFLLFQVQPMVSKAILPWFGGGPAVWTAAMLFFQCVLFGGYVYAHLLASIGSARREALLHLALLAVAAVAVALSPGRAARGPPQSIRRSGEVRVRADTCVIGPVRLKNKSSV